MTNGKVEEAKLPYDKCVEIDMEVEETSNNQVASRNNIFTTNKESKKVVSKWVGSPIKYFNKEDLRKVEKFLPQLVFTIFILPIVIMLRYHFEGRFNNFGIVVLALLALWGTLLPLFFFIFLERQVYTLIERKMKQQDYLVPSGVIDCPISYKKLLSILVFGEVGATYIKAVKGELLFYTEDGNLIKKGDDMTIPENGISVKKFCNVTNKEKKYLTDQMINDRFYKISDIITDVPVEYIEK